MMFSRSAIPRFALNYRAAECVRNDPSLERASAMPEDLLRDPVARPTLLCRRSTASRLESTVTSRLAHVHKLYECLIW